MKTETLLKYLKRQCGTWQKVADQMGISRRHLLNVRKGKHIGKFLAKTIRELKP